MYGIFVSTRLVQVISRLRNEVESLRMEASPGRRDGRGGGGGTAAGPEAPLELRRLREENSSLRQQLKQLDRFVKADGTENERMTAESRDLARELKLVRG